MYQTYITLILIIILLYIIIKLIKEKNKDNDTNIRRIEELKEKELTKEDNNINKNQYKKKYFLTNTEKQFLSILYELKKYNLIIIPQINLATIIQKTGEFRYQNELYRNIDFGIFDKNYNILLLIELNDISHQQYKRRERDMKVKEIVKQADIKLINFYI